jgi:hypothetical protein
MSNTKLANHLNDQRERHLLRREGVPVLVTPAMRAQWAAEREAHQANKAPSITKTKVIVTTIGGAILLLLAVVLL